VLVAFLQQREDKIATFIRVSGQKRREITELGVSVVHHDKVNQNWTHNRLGLGPVGAI
jgi:hypothetical protein